MKSLYSQYTYLKNFVAPVLVKTFTSDSADPNQLIVLSESEEAAQYLVDQQVGDILTKMGSQNLKEIHITDQKVYNNL